MKNDLDLDCPFCAIASAFPSPATSVLPQSIPITSSPPSSLVDSSHSLNASTSPDIAPSATLIPASAAGQDTDTNPQGNLSALRQCIPTSPNPTKTRPQCNLVLSAPGALAFLDIMPMTRGHLLVTSRAHRVRVGDLRPDMAADVGFWLPLLARAVCTVTGVTDYNIVQNNGHRAAQVVPHVHFHIIPRPAHAPAVPLPKSMSSRRTAVPATATAAVTGKGGSGNGAGRGATGPGKKKDGEGERQGDVDPARSWTMFGRGPRDDLDEGEGEALAAELRAALAREVEGLGLARRDGDGDGDTGGADGGVKAKI